MSVALSDNQSSLDPVLWVVEVLADGVWTLRNGPLSSYDEARNCVNERMRDKNTWRIRGGPDVMDTVVEPTLGKSDSKKKKQATTKSK